MKILTAIFLSVYFLGSALILPESNFAAIKDLPAMYAHCKQTEDVDMDLVDFFTDHLINIDGLFDQHPPGDEQKPHKPFTYTTHFNTGPLTQKVTGYVVSAFHAPIKKEYVSYITPVCVNGFISDIFRPPIVFNYSSQLV